MRRLLGALFLLCASFVAIPAHAGAEAVDRVEALGTAIDSGSPSVAAGHRPVEIAPAPGGGYWIATDDGGVFTFGGAGFFGSAGDQHLASPVVAIAAHPSGKGYWLVAADGGVFAFGRSGFSGSLGGVRLAAPIVGIASTVAGDGYWLVGADGDVYAFGAATDQGGLAGTALASPIVGMAASPEGGYWLAGGDGGVFAYGRARYAGSAGDLQLQKPVTAIVSSPTGGGYWLAARDGGVFTYGDAPFHGAATTPGEPVVSMAAAGTKGYWLLRAPEPPPPAFWPAVPAGSGSGRRIVYSNPMQRVWLIDGNDRVINSHLVSGKYHTPAPSTYHIFSKSRHADAGHDGIVMDDMVRFARSASGLAIGFHGIPRQNGRPLQSDSDLGGFRSSGCVRQSASEAAFLYDWSNLGDTVVVLW